MGRGRPGVLRRGEARRAPRRLLPHLPRVHARRPRTVAAAAALFPVKWAAAGIAVGDAIALGLLAAIVYRASAPFIRNPWLRVVPALLIAACPVGQETIGSIANLQWFLFFAAVVVLLWNPRRPLPIAIGVVTVLFATMSSPFGILLIPLAGMRLLVFLASRASAIPVAALAGFGMQTLIMAGATGRTSYTTVVPGKLTSLFVSGVVGQGFFGARYSAPWSALGAVAVIAIAAAWALVVATGRLRSFTAASVTLVYALVFFAVPVVLDGMTIGQPPAYRYYVGPLLLIVFAVTVMLDGACAGRITSTGPRPTGRYRRCCAPRCWCAWATQPSRRTAPRTPPGRRRPGRRP